MVTLYPEQVQPCDQALAILNKMNLVYIAAEVRSGKTPISLMCAYRSGWRRICVLTTKKAISGFEKFNPRSMFTSFTIMNYINNHKNIEKMDNAYFDGFILDEGHRLGAFPKPGKSAEAVKKLVGNKPLIILSGTPSPESFSQTYHQFWISNFGPFQRYWNPKNKGSGFYGWAKDYVKQYEELDSDGNKKYHVKQKFVYGNTVNDYSEAIEDKVKDAIRPYSVYLTQQQAGFTSYVDEEIISVPVDKRLYQLMKILKRDKYYKMKNGEEIVVETGVRLQSLFHQISSGTVNITKIQPGKDGGKGKEIKLKFTLDESKAYYIKSKFSGQKISIYYKYIQEGHVLRKVFPNCTEDSDLFNKRDDLVFICQMISGREGVNLSTCDALIMYNIDFSATTYWQIRARMQEKERTKASKLYWLFSEHGIEWRIHKAVVKKQNYTLSYFKKDLRNWNFDGVKTAA